MAGLGMGLGGRRRAGWGRSTGEEVCVDEAVGDYLAALRADAEADRAREGLEVVSDPLERLRLRQRLLDHERALDRAEQAFVVFGRSWAEANGVTGRALWDEGVPAHVLRLAGVPVIRPRSGRQRRTTRDQVRRAMGSEPFSVRDLRGRVAASERLIRVVIEEGLADGTVVEAEPTARGGRRYRRVR